MKVIINVTSNFKKEAKPLLKRHKSLSNDLSGLEKDLINDPYMGIALGNHAFKIKLKIASKGKGKSGGARVITYVETELIANLEFVNELIVVNLISIYDKTDTDSISDKELKALIANLG